MGYYNRKPIEGNNVLNSACLIWKNYKSKSEKQRHVQILSELTKLKGYLEKDENKKILYIKDFLNKYSINYDNNKISLFEKFMDDFDVKNYEKFLEPGLGIKDMITKIFDKGEKFIMENNKNEEKKEIPPVINLKSNINNKMYNKIERCKMDLQKDPSNPALHVRLGDYYLKWHYIIHHFFFLFLKA